MPTPAERKGMEQLHTDLWWIAEELFNIADAIEPASSR